MIQVVAARAYAWTPIGESRLSDYKESMAISSLIWQAIIFKLLPAKFTKNSSDTVFGLEMKEEYSEESEKLENNWKIGLTVV